MGCCLGKKSRENKIKRDTALLKDHKLNDQRGLSLNGDRNELIHTQSITSQDNYNYNSNSNGNYNYNNSNSNNSNSNNNSNNNGEGYEPPSNQYNDNKINKNVVGKSLIEPPSVDDLFKSDIIEKRGHMIRNWKKRFIVLHDGEIQYFDQVDKSGKGVGLKGQINLLGAYCEIKTDPDGLPTLEIVGRQGEKDLLLKFTTFVKAREWAEAINWTIYGWNTRCIESGEEIPEIIKWYNQQLVIFEDSFVILSNGIQFTEHKINHLNGQLMLNPCTLQGARQDLCIAIIGKGNRNRKIILLVDIIDVIIGSYPDDDIPMMAIVTKSLGTLNFQIPEDSESWIEALRKVLMFLQMPIPQGMKSVIPSTDNTNSKKSKKNRKTSTNL